MADVAGSGRGVDDGGGDGAPAGAGRGRRPAAGPVQLHAAARRARHDARRHRPALERVHARPRRQLPRDPDAAALQQGRRADLRLRVARLLRLALLRRRDPGRPRPVQVGRVLLHLPQRGHRRLRHDRVGRAAPEGQRQGRHVRVLLSGGDAVAARHPAPAAPRDDRAGDDVLRLPRRLDLRGRRARPVLRRGLADDHDRQQRRAALSGRRRAGRGDEPGRRRRVHQVVPLPAARGSSRRCTRRIRGWRPTSSTG